MEIKETLYLNAKCNPRLDPILKGKMLQGHYWNNPQHLNINYSLDMSITFM